MVRVIIPCDGKADRWDNYLGIPKQLIVLEGEVLLERTIRLCQKRGENDIYVIASKKPIVNVAQKMNANVTPANHDQYTVGVDKLLSSESVWSATEDTVILLGDVYFTDDAIDTILKPVSVPTFYGRMHVSKMTRKGQELYAVKFRPEDIPLVKSHAEYIKWSINAGYIDWKRDVLKTVMSSMTNSSYDYFDCVESKYLQTIDDWTEDFDRPKDYIVWKRERCKRKNDEP